MSVSKLFKSHQQHICRLVLAVLILAFTTADRVWSHSSSTLSSGVGIGVIGGAPVVSPSSGSSDSKIVLGQRILSVTVSPQTTRLAPGVVRSLRLDWTINLLRNNSTSAVVGSSQGSISGRRVAGKIQGSTNTSTLKITESLSLDAVLIKAALLAGRRQLNYVRQFEFNGTSGIGEAVFRLDATILSNVVADPPPVASFRSQ
ncbi:MAG: hypothetical protein ACI8P9_000739 [Parasphingorhabdus sp.]|jgi:hypothetical protein